MANIFMLLDKGFPNDDLVEMEIHSLKEVGHEVNLVSLNCHQDQAIGYAYISQPKNMYKLAWGL